MEIDNGYFINSGKNVIKCESSKCGIQSIGDSCNNHENEIIAKDDSLKFCNGKEEISLLNDDIRYYKLSNVNASSIFPKKSKGLDTLLIKIDQFSVIQYVDSKSNTNIINSVFNFLNIHLFLIIFYKYFFLKKYILL